MAVVYRFVMECSNEGSSSILATNDLIERMGVTDFYIDNDRKNSAKYSVWRINKICQRRGSARSVLLLFGAKSSGKYGVQLLVAKF